jgi:hypothetical protein
MVSDSEVDEVIATLQYRGHGSGLHSQCYSIVSLALSVAGKIDLDATSKLSWCESCLLDGFAGGETQAAAQLAKWLSPA